MYGNSYSMAIVLDHRSTATSLTGNRLLNVQHTAGSARQLYNNNLNGATDMSALYEIAKKDHHFSNHG